MFFKLSIGSICYFTEWKKMMYVFIYVKLGWSYAEKYLLTFLLNLSGVCPDEDTILFYPCSFIFWTLFYLEQRCEALLNFPCEKMILSLSVHQAWWLGKFERRYKMYLLGSWKYKAVISTCHCKRAWQIYCYPDFTVVSYSTYGGHIGTYGCH